MKWYNFLFVFPLLIIIIQLFLYLNTSKITLKNQPSDFSSKIQIFKLTSSKLNFNYQNLVFRPFLNEIEFSDNSTKIIFSTQKNIYTQFVVLQNLSKKANIIGKQLTLIDFAQNHPYATFKNN
ncbi:MAG TPA: hypothetical protein PK370_00135 [Candidatus Woesebacteria bacterium]|nr:hypothetical protein [Candidatus Woesebacteria bacterium]HPJ17056.1 hypothetical protein [Candidatus Woesebacteria bacterium]